MNWLTDADWRCGCSTNWCGCSILSQPQRRAAMQASVRACSTWVASATDRLTRRRTERNVLTCLKFSAGGTPTSAAGWPGEWTAARRAVCRAARHEFYTYECALLTLQPNLAVSGVHRPGLGSLVSAYSCLCIVWVVWKLELCRLSPFIAPSSFSSNSKHTL